MKLIIINGPCGIGKSTVARALHDTMPLSYLIDVDDIGCHISHYREYKEERWVLRDTIAKAIAETCLSLGRDVIVEKMIYDELLLNAFHDIAIAHTASVYEFILWAPKEIVMKRADDRGWREGGLLTPEKCEILWEKIDELKNKRSNAIIIDVTNLSEDVVLSRLQEHII